MFSDLDNVLTSDIDNRAADTFGRVDYDVVVLGHMKRIQLSDILAGPIQNTLIDCIRYTVVDEFCKHQAVLAMIKHLKGVRGKRQQVTNVRIAGKNSINVPRELGPLIFIDRVRNIFRRPLNMYFPSNAALGDVARRRCSIAWRRSGCPNWTSGRSALRRNSSSSTEFGYEL